jgi:dienelactone hydrolase
MKKFLKILVSGIVVIAVLFYGYLVYTTEKNRAVPAPTAIAALQSSAAVDVADGDWLVMTPTGVIPTTGVIVYSGANCDIHGYAALMHAVAAEGYLVIAPSMPFDFSIFDPYAADDIRAAYPDIGNWVIVGHSMGGAMAGMYAYDNQDNLGGLILWDSYPPETSSLADSELPVMHIHRATLEGQPPESFTEMAHVYPPHTMWVPVPGGIHMYFGHFIGGGYNEAWEPKISNAAQAEIIVAATLEGLSKMQ